MRALIFTLLLGSSYCCSIAQRVSLSLDCTEATAVLTILSKINSNDTVTGSDWRILFNTLPYQQLKEREAGIHNPFTDSGFKKFVTSPELVAAAADLKRTLQAWQSINLDSVGRNVLAYLPKDAVLKAKVFVLIKPGKNSFVWGRQNDKAIFLYLNPALSAAQFMNKVTHELHHIGMESLDTMQERMLRGLSRQQQTAVQWLGGFGEGAAMLAAAGDYRIHPHALDNIAVQQQWDKDMAHFNTDVDSLQLFYEKIVNGNLATDDQITAAAEKFWGVQGAWYTVGYRMCSLVEKYFGREQLIQCFVDPRKLLVAYNQAAQQENKKGANLRLWSAGFLEKLGCSDVEKEKQPLVQ